MTLKLNKVGEYIDEVLEPVSINLMQEEQCDLCKLCNGDKKTEWYYEDKYWIICDCKTCHRPMIVYKKHTMFIPFTDWFCLHTKLISLFGSQITLRFKQRKIYDHFHVHIYRDEVR